jgi:hypothetical protein
MGMLKTYDDFLPEREFKALQDILTGPEFPWSYQQYVTAPSENSVPKLNVFFFTHTFYANNLPRSNYYQILEPLIQKISPLAVCRLKANLNTRTEEIVQYDFHTDYTVRTAPMKTAVFYMNTNNGSTIFESGEKVTSQENRLVVFDSYMKHAGTTCTDQQARVLVNLNFIDW